MQRKQQHMLVRTKLKQLRPQRRLYRHVKATTRRSRQRARKLALADRNNRKHSTRRLSRKNLLPRHPKRLRIDRPKDLVPLNKVIKRSRKRSPIQLPTQPDRQRDHIAADRALKTVQEPKPALRIRQRDLGRPLHRQQRTPTHSTRRQRPPNALIKTRYAWRLKQRSDRYLNVQHRTQPADQPRRQQRVPAQLKEVVVDPDPLDTQDLGKQAAQNLLARRARRTPHRATQILRLRQRTAVELAVRCQRQRVQNHNRRRHQMLGQFAQKLATQHRPAQRSTTRPNHIPHQPPRSRAIANLVLPRNHNSLRNTGPPSQRRLDLARLDPEPAKLDLAVRPAQEFEHPIRAPARQVPAAVHPAARLAIRVRNKPLRRQTKPIEITTRDPLPRNVKLANNTCRNNLKTTIQYVDPVVRQRPTNRNVRAALVAVDRIANCVNRRFGRAVQIGDPRHIHRPRNLSLQFGCERLPTQHQMIERQSLWRIANDGFEI